MGKITTCQQKLVNLLTADAFFAAATANPFPAGAVPVILKRQGDLETQIDEKLAQVGVGLVVLLRNVTFPENDQPDINVDVQWALSVIENPTVNDTGKSDQDIFEKALVLVHYKPNGVATFDETHPGRFLVDKRAGTPVPALPKNIALSILLLLVNTSINLN